jgi:hypothetical protein
MNLLRLSEVSKLLNVSLATARKLEIPGRVRVGQRDRFREDAVHAFINSGGGSIKRQPANQLPQL